MEDLCLLGNPCASYAGYRDFVIAALPALTLLDGQEVTREERIEAERRMERTGLRAEVERQQREYMVRREREREEAEEEIRKGRKGYEDPGTDFVTNRTNFYKVC